jgi:putative endonuclease
MNNLELGKIGENWACEHLVEKGFCILERNYRYQKSEIDIIAQKNELLIFVEVKLRTTVEFGYPEDFVNKKKKKLLMNAINEYLSVNQSFKLIRFDIISILLTEKSPQILHFEDAWGY